MSRWRQALEHWPGSTSLASASPPIFVFTRCVHLRVALPSCLPGPTDLTVPRPSRRCQGCSHLPERLLGQAAPSFSGLLRQAAGGPKAHPVKWRLVAHVAVGGLQWPLPGLRPPRPWPRRTRRGRCPPVPCRAPFRPRPGVLYRAPAVQVDAHVLARYLFLHWGFPPLS
jgi:hypothetical protein